MVFGFDGFPNLVNVFQSNSMSVNMSALITKCINPLQSLETFGLLK